MSKSTNSSRMRLPTSTNGDFSSGVKVSPSLPEQPAQKQFCPLSTSSSHSSILPSFIYLLLGLNFVIFSLKKKKKKKKTFVFSLDAFGPTLQEKSSSKDPGPSDNTCGTLMLGLFPFTTFMTCRLFKVERAFSAAQQSEEITYKLKSLTK